MLTDELLAYIFDGQAHLLVPEFADWMASSARFRAFAETYRTKIRKKVRGARDAEGISDLRFELEVAYVLLQERRFTLEYEKYGAGKQRGPDFTVTFKTRIPFNVEVKRLRAGSLFSKLPDIVCDKIGQLPPGMINILFVAAGSAERADRDIAQAMARLKDRIDHKDADFFARSGFGGLPIFLRHYRRLSGVLVQGSEDRREGSVLWVNPQAKHQIPRDLHALLCNWEAQAPPPR